jgi:hypothetical protein
MRRFALHIVLLTVVFLSYGQQGGELRCNISLETSKVQGTNKRVFQTLQTALYEFMNNRTWTTHVYAQSEKIECNILINVNEYSGDEFKASITIQSRRPVYGSSYSTTILNYIDNSFVFRYAEYEPLEFNETQFLSNLTSTMAFYAYVILGLDYDTFSLEGGTEFFKKAETIVNNAQNSNDDGWKPFTAKANKNRYWLVKNILDKNYQPCREFMYKYHRLGLDNMSKKQAEARMEIVSDLELLRKVYQQKPDPFMHYLNQVILEAKYDEFANVFSDGMPDERSRAYNILMEIDPTHAPKFEKIMKQQN